MGGLWLAAPRLRDLLLDDVEVRLQDFALVAAEAAADVVGDAGLRRGDVVVIARVELHHREAPVTMRSLPGASNARSSSGARRAPLPVA